jgi:hypothetical protein
MSYWVREIAGWLLTGVGLLMLLQVYFLCEERRIFDATLVLVAGIFVFRGGIHLLKVAVAARISAKAQDRLYPATPSGAGPRPTAQRR